MNYQRIYDQFIADRRLKEPEAFKGRLGPARLYQAKAGNAPTGYEHHHILPKSLGGLDDPQNIISLTLDEHWFAHCLLAKIYGGSMWTALWCMAKLSKDGTEDRPKFLNRRLWAAARKESAKFKSDSYSGKPQPDRRKYVTVYNKDGRSFSGYITEVSDHIGASIGTVSRLATRNQSSTRSGWYAFKDETDKKRVYPKGRPAPNQRAVICIETGEIFANRELAADSLGLGTSRNITSVCQGKRTHAGGYHWAYA